VREAGLFLRVVFLRVVVLGLDLLLLLNDRLDLPTAGWWRGTFSETGVSLLLIRQALPDLRHLQRADACFRVREGYTPLQGTVVRGVDIPPPSCVSRRHPLVICPTNPMTGSVVPNRTRRNQISTMASG